MALDPIVTQLLCNTIADEYNALIGTTFTITVPPDRSFVVIEPNDPGATNVYSYFLGRVKLEEDRAALVAATVARGLQDAIT